MKITFLGTGTSHGVPMIGCDCDVCNSINKKNKRLRSSLLIQNKKGDNLLIDCSKDFREQALTYNINKIENVLITHSHADHVFGLDELRVYTKKNDNCINIYLSKRDDKKIRKQFEYIYNPPKQKGGGISKLKNIIIKQEHFFNVFTFKITPILIYHGELPVFGYRINNIAYLTDCSMIPEKSYQNLQNLDCLIVDALREKSHPTHFTLKQAINEAKRIKAKQTYFTHISHKLEHLKINSILSKNMQLAYDGLVLEF